MFKNKKALSEVVSTVLIVLITVVSGALIAQVLIPYIGNTLAKSSECLDYTGYFQFEEKIDSKKYNCLDNQTTKNPPTPTDYLLFGASVKATASEKEVKNNVDGFNLVFIGETGAKSFVVKPGKTIADLSLLGSPTPLKVPSTGEVFTYVYKETDLKKNYQIIEVYPILKSGRECTAVRDRIEIKPCIGVSLT